MLASGPLSVLPAFFLWDEVGVTAELWKNVTASMLLLRALLAPGHCGSGCRALPGTQPERAALGPWEKAIRSANRTGSENTIFLTSFFSYSSFLFVCAAW